ncbi:uncharacterized protein LOC125852068 [Solanum stenotomum]|uniref:uncharacterized protein LOC125852068 n=1 Tax=Solanum stenotomum TaxID=172797 RepID=UPI0020D0D694|nr:uncharacterized protein LOC125852068 [Solanum stenotomum]
MGVDVVAEEGTSQPPPNQAVQTEAQDESLSQTSLTPPSPEDIRREAAPQEPTINATEQEGSVAGTSGVNRAVGTRIRDFLNLDLPSFTGSDPNEDPQDFIDQIQRTLDVMHVSGKEALELTAYRLKGVAILWYEAWKQSRGIEAPSATWKEFIKAFLDYYLPLEIREARVDQFLNLHQGNMSVREYNLKFNSLARYTPNVVTTMEDRVHQYMDRLDSYLVRDCTIASLNKDMDIERMQAFAQKLKDQRQRRRTQESETGHSKRARSMGQFTPSQGHLMRNCPHRDMGGVAQPTRSVVASSSSPPSLGRGHMSTGRGRGFREAASSSGVQICTYALGDRQNLEASPDVVTVCDRDTLADLVEIEMVDFNVIISMDWLASCYAMVDCQTKMVHFHFPKEAVLQWKGNIGAPRGKFISYIKAKKMMYKGYICHLVRVKNIYAEPAKLQSISVVNEFPDVFPEDLLEDDQANHLRQVLQILRDRKLYAKFSKCYYRWFVQGFSSIAAPLTKLTHKETKFQWSDECERSFQELKNKLTFTPVLVVPEGTEGYAVYCDVSEVGLGSVLMQHDFKGSWDDHLPLTEFAYNNSYHSSIKLSPYEALYGKKCRSPIGWFETGETALFGPDLVHKAMEKVKVIQQWLETVQS